MVSPRQRRGRKMDSRGSEDTLARLTEAASVQQDLTMGEARQSRRAGLRPRRNQSVCAYGCCEGDLSRRSPLPVPHLCSPQTTVHKVSTDPGFSLDEHVHQEEEVQGGTTRTPGELVGERRSDDFLGHGRRISLTGDSCGLPEVFPVSVRGTLLSISGTPLWMDPIPSVLHQDHARVQQGAQEGRTQDPRICGRLLTSGQGGTHGFSEEESVALDGTFRIVQETREGALGTFNPDLSPGSAHRHSPRADDTRSRQCSQVGAEGTSDCCNMPTYQEKSGHQELTEFPRSLPVCDHSSTRAGHLPQTVVRRGGSRVAVEPPIWSSGKEGSFHPSLDLQHASMAHVGAPPQDLGSDRCKRAGMGRTCSPRPEDHCYGLWTLDNEGTDVPYHEKGDQGPQEGATSVEGPDLGSVGAGQRCLSHGGLFSQESQQESSSAEGATGHVEILNEESAALASGSPENCNSRQHGSGLIISTLLCPSFSPLSHSLSLTRSAASDRETTPRRATRTYNRSTPMGQSSVSQSSGRDKPFSSLLSSIFNLPLLQHTEAQRIYGCLYNKSTLDTYDRAMRDYKEVVSSPTPLTPHNLLTYAGTQLARGIAPTTFSVSLSALTTYNTLAGHSIPSLVTDSLKRGYKQAYYQQHTKSTPLLQFVTVPQFHHLIHQDTISLTPNEIAIVYLLYLFGLRPSSFNKPITVQRQDHNLMVVVHHVKKKGEGAISISRPLPPEAVPIFSLSPVILSTNSNTAPSLCRRLSSVLPGLHPKAFRTGLVTVGRAVGVPDLTLQRILLHKVINTLDEYTYPYVPSTTDAEFFAVLLPM
jgi:hypothetical protein